MYCNNSVPAASFRIPRAACERDIALDPSHLNARLLALQRARARTLDPSHSKTTRALEPSHSHDERYLLASFFLLAFKFRVSCTVHEVYAVLKITDSLAIHVPDCYIPWCATTCTYTHRLTHGFRRYTGNIHEVLINTARGRSPRVFPCMPSKAMG